MDPSNPTAGSNPQIPLVRVALADLRQDPGNARSHDRRNLDAIRESLATFGQVLPVVVRHGQIVGGNATAQAAQELGWTHLDATPADHLSEPEAVALAIALNRTAELADWDTTVLLESLQGLPTLEGTGYTAEELAELEAAVRGEGGAPGLTDPDEVPEPPVEPVTRPGDLWLLGAHRLLCGDATVVTDAERLMAGEQADCLWTDPPYGVNYVGKTPDELTISNDDSEGLAALLRDAFATATLMLKPGAAVAIAHPAGALSLTFGAAFVGAGWRLHQRLVWVKDVFVLGHSDYHYRHEDIIYGYTPGEGRRGRGGEGWYGGHDQDSVFEIPRPKRSEAHPTMKPVELVARMLANSCPHHGTVLDLFGGSGSTLLAAHQTGRRALLMDLDARYVDVACRRWQEFTGEKPILEATGEPHDFTSPP